MAARKPPLRAVAPGETKPAAPKTVAQAAASGDHRALLVAMRERIAVTVSNPDCPPRDLAALTTADVAALTTAQVAALTKENAQLRAGPSHSTKDYRPLGMGS